MIKAILMYGSRARDDAGADSDIDLLGVTIGNEAIDRVLAADAVSLHLYPENWLKEESQRGALFLLHLVKEATVVYDPQDVLNDLRRSFQSRSYVSDRYAGALVVAAVLQSGPNQFHNIMRRRYFWGIRTALMAAAADKGTPAFSAAELQQLFAIDGLETHIRGRDSATFQDCSKFGRIVLSSLGHSDLLHTGTSSEERLRALMTFGGAAKAFARTMLYSE